MHNDHTTPAADKPAVQRKAWTVDEARTLLGGISRASLYELINSGELRTAMIAGRRLVPDDAIDELLARKSGSAEAA